MKKEKLKKNITAKLELGDSQQKNLPSLPWEGQAPAWPFIAHVHHTQKSNQNTTKKRVS